MARKKKTPGPKKTPGSMGSDGFATLGVSVPTRNKLKQLAGSTPVSEYLRHLTDELTAGKPILPGLEKGVSKATLNRIVSENEKMVAEMAALRESYNNVELAICWMVRQFTDKPLNTGIRRNLKSFVESIKANPDNQGELPI